MQRYTVDLGGLFSDHRRKVFVGRRQQWKHVACLLEHIRYVFNLDSHIYLTNSDNVLFPEREELDVIQESDQLIVHSSNSLNGTHDTHQISAQKEPADGESRVAVVNQNGKRKRDSLSKLKPTKPSPKVEESSSSDSDSSDDDDNVLPKLFVEMESMSRPDESIQELPKPKRKRIRKRKSKKVEVNTPPKVVVKTYGKSKMPAIAVENGTHSNHIRFGKAANGEISDEETENAKNEPYRNLNKITVPRVIKAVQQPSAPLALNGETPSVPDYEDDPGRNMVDTAKKTKTAKRQPRTRKKSLEIKQELIEANTERAASPTWDTEMDQAKETFLSAYSGAEFWVTLQDALENFPTIAIPSVNDIIAYQIDAQSYLALVERADDGESDDRPALKLTMRKLNGAAQAAQPVMLSATLDQLTGIRLVATYQP